MPKLKGEQLEKICFQLLCAAGAPEDHGRIVAEHLAGNNLAGHDSHGFIRIIQYIRQIKEGVILPAAKPEIVRETPVIAQVDGHYGFGQVVAKFSAELVIDKAKKQGLGCVAMRRLRHLGRLGAWVELAAKAGCAAILFTATGGQALLCAPFGGSKRRLGTNPIAMAFPGENEGMVVSDFATSAAAEGKIRVYKARGHKLPDGWILDKEGRPSNNPNDFYDGGAILPVGGSVGHKGYCLAFMTELFGSLLSRDGFPPRPGDKQMSNSSLFLALDIERFGPLAAVKSEVSMMANYAKETPPADGFDQVLFPGEKEAKSRRERSKTGVEIEDETWNQVMALVKEYRIGEKLGQLP
ncbi:MAG: Ldh family oxidoreductase [Syntrophaceae bacterium]|nr:Ldh family oxidoreductase [Syntrophaceae bacterium]